MDLVHLIAHRNDIRQSELISSFLRYLGLYCVKTENNHLSPKAYRNTACIIRIVSNYDHHVELADDDAFNKTIYVFCDGFRITDYNLFSVQYFPNCDKEMLSFLISCISKIVSWIDEASCNKILNAYFDNNLFPTDSIFLKCSDQKSIFSIAKNNHLNFIRDIESYSSNFFIKHAVLYAKYQCNLLYKKALTALPTSITDLSDNCNKLLKKHPANESLYFIKADIIYYFNYGKDLWATDEYANSNISYLPEALYKRMYIYCIFEEHEQVELGCSIILKNYPDYYKALYVLGSSLLESSIRFVPRDLNIIIMNYFIKLAKMLEEKFQKKLLSIDEIVFLQRSILKISRAYIHLGNVGLAYQFFEISEFVKGKCEVAISKYVKLISDDQVNGLISDISASTKKRFTDITFEELCYCN